jgi:hypothetical protein
VGKISARELENFLTPVIKTTGSTYTAAAWEAVLVKLAVLGTFAVTLPTAPQAGAIVYIKDANNDATNHNITVLPGGSDTIEGDTSLLMTLNRMSITLMYDGVSAWYLI